MSILKALQKKQAEDANGIEIPFSANVVPFNKSERKANVEPELFTKKDIKIGTPSLAFNGQSDSFVGKALPEMKTKIAAGATLNAVGLTRVAENNLPDFIGWEVEAERVEPRLVAITHSNSHYCEEYRSLAKMFWRKRNIITVITMPAAVWEADFLIGNSQNSAISYFII